MNTALLMEGMSNSQEYSQQLIEDFKSSVYSSYHAYVADIFMMSANENTQFALSFENNQDLPSRTKEQRQLILIKKVNASIRHSEHLRKGGTDIGFKSSISDVFKALG